MLYQYEEIKKSRAIEKIFLKEISEIYSILKHYFEIDEYIPEFQMSLEDLEAIEKLTEIGIVNSKENIPFLKEFIDKKGPCTYHEFIYLIKLLVRDYPLNHESCPIKKYCETYRSAKMLEEEIVDKPTIIDLFSGAGGMSLGFKQEGYKIALANDIEQCCVETYIHNHPEIPKEYIINDDIDKVITDIEKKMRFDEIDIVIGGPPCQGFSNANRQRLIDDPRNKLYKSYVQIVEKVQPKFFVMENVEGMKGVADQVQEDFRRIGYELNYKVLNAVDFGVPQKRKRLIFIGNRLGVNNEEIFVKIDKACLNSKRFVLKDALTNLRKLTALQIKNATELDTEEHGRKIDRNNYLGEDSDFQLLINDNNPASKVVFNHKARFNNERDIEIFSRLDQGDKSDDPKIADIMPYSSRNDIFKDKYYKLENSKPSKTITAHMKFDCNMYIHPTQARGLTPREAARIQTYPDDYFFKGSFTKTYMQIGNSVPPLMSRTIANILKEYVVYSDAKQHELYI
ncbi:DNA cytosine methyltransferase [Bacillus sp. V3]|nr:DNA cytosine methyltransferase [Bacillus sp. V3]